MYTFLIILIFLCILCIVFVVWINCYCQFQRINMQRNREQNRGQNREIYRQQNRHVPPIIPITIGRKVEFETNDLVIIYAD